MKTLKHFLMLGIFCMISIGASAEEIPNDEIWYTSSDGKVVLPYKSNYFGADIVSNTYTNGKGVIKFNGNVTSIGEYAFYCCSGLTSVTVPNSVTSIGDDAFDTCSNLASVIIGNSVTSISKTAFSYCSSLTSIKVVSGNMIYDSRDNCNAIIETASNTLICGCKNTTIPNTVISIGANAFCGSGLTTVTIPNSVTSIGGGAFQNSRSLTSVSIPNSVTSIGSGVFFGCSGLASITVESDNTIYDSRDNCNAIIETASNTLISGCQNTTIPNSVTSIGLFAFYGSSGLTSVTIPNSVTEIGSSAFGGCSGLTSVTIPNSVTSIGESAFSGCSGLTSVYVEWKDAGKIPSIDNRCFPFSTCDLYAPTGIKTIYQNKEYWRTFRNIYEYEPETEPTTDIPNDEIWYTSSDENVVTPNNSNAFGANIVSNTYTNGKGIIKFNGNVTSIGDRAFAYCSGLTSVTIPNSVTSIGDYAFYGCSSLTSVTIPNSVTYIGHQTFNYCSSLSSIVVESGNAKYDSRNNCNAIIETATNTLIAGSNNAKIPNNVVKITSTAFQGSGVASVEIPASVTTIELGAFKQCESLTNIVVSSGNTKYDSRNNCNAIIETTTNTLITGCINTTIPNSVTSIGSYAFEGCLFSNIVTESGSAKSVISSNNVVPESKTDVMVADLKRMNEFNSKDSVMVISFKNNPNSLAKKSAFAGSSSATLVIPNSVTSIGYDAFWNCYRLTSVELSNQITSIGGSAFEYCYALTSVTIGNSVTSIGEGAFSGCDELTSVTVKATTPPGIESNTFNDFTKPVLYVPSGALEAYKGHSKWGKFTNIQAISMSYTKEDLDAIRAVWECEAADMIYRTQVLKQGLVDFYTDYYYIKKYLLLFANDEQKVKLETIDNYVQEIQASLAEMEQGIRYYLESYLARLYNCTTDAEVEQLVAECNEILEYYYYSLTTLQQRYYVIVAELNEFYQANAQLILSAVLAAKDDLVVQLSAAGNDCRTLQKAFETLKALCGTKAGMIDPSILSNEIVAAFEKDLNALLLSMESCESDYDENVSRVVPTDVETGVSLARSMSRIYNDILDIEKKCADLKIKYEEVEEIMKSGKIVLSGDANDDGTVNVNDITTIATYILNGTASPWNEKNADANEDGSINVNDITATATIILGGDDDDDDDDDDSRVYLKCPDDHHPHVIDLGLPSGTKWCCCNVGSSTPEGYGGYYAWGETSEKDVYNWDTYAYGSSMDNCQNIGSDIAGTQYDVAHVRMGGSWRMPNVDQIKELKNNCTRTWTNQNGVNGILVTGKNGGQIFLPAAGYRWFDDLYNAGSYGYHWSSSLSPSGGYYAYDLSFNSGGWDRYGSGRLYGFSVRAVCP